MRKRFPSLPPRIFSTGFLAVELSRCQIIIIREKSAVCDGFADGTVCCCSVARCKQLCVSYASVRTACTPTGMRSADDVEIRALEFQYGRNKSGNLAAYLNTLTLYPRVHLGIPR